jgi:hypothetical protein
LLLCLYLYVNLCCKPFASPTLSDPRQYPINLFSVFSPSLLPYSNRNASCCAVRCNFRAHGPRFEQLRLIGWPLIVCNVLILLFMQ